tara:strand:+ start:749 stop:1585 length:837 start_codon:yes stop_codon:yes gene_type:complete
VSRAALQQEMIQALAWYADHGVRDIWLDEAQDHTKLIETVPSLVSQISQSQPVEVAAPAFLGKSDAYEEAVKLAAGAGTLEELQSVLAEFDGIALKKTATNMVFCDGNPKAPVMLVGEAPGADEDRQGKPFVGASGQLLDKILACIGLDRCEEDPSKSIYISNILNWRPPGNRTPSPAEVELSLPFIERHIQLVQPKILILCGGVSAKALLNRSEGISRLRKTWHQYKPQTKELVAISTESIPAIATYHPSYLLRSPAQKKLVWADMLEIAQKMNNFT